MYKKAKTLKEEIFVLSHLYLISKFGIKSSNDEEIAKLSQTIEDLIRQLVTTYSNKTYEQWVSIINKLNFRLYIQEFINEDKSSHKFVLVLQSLLQSVIDEGYIITEDIMNIFDIFLEIEYAQQISDTDWKALRKSAEKRAKQLKAKLNKEDLFC